MRHLLFSSLLFSSLLFSSLLFSLAMLSYSCEKEPLALAPSPSEEEAALIEAVNVQVDGPAPAYQSVTEIPVNLQEGALQFEGVVELRRALNTLAQTSDEDYKAWAVGADFNTPYLQYLVLQEQLEAGRAPLKASALSTEQEKFLFIDQDGVPRFKVPYFQLMKVINVKDGVFQTSSTINYYTADHHFVIPDNQYDVLKMIQNNPLADYSEKGVLIEGIEVQRAYNPMTGEEKVERFNFTCPIGLSNGPANNRIGISIKELIDERRIDGQRQRLVSNIVFTNSIVTGTLDRDILQRMEVEYENEKRSWFTWIGTQPGTSFAQQVDFNTPTPSSNGPEDDDITMTRNLRVFRSFAGGFLRGFVTIFDVDGPISEANTTDFMGERNDTRGSCVFDDFSFSYSAPFLSETDWDLSYFMADGAARVFWSGRDTNDDLDHVSGDFHCN
jgi:hypothetical protein